MEDLRARTTLFCAVIAFAIALSVMLRGRRAVHWLFAAFATDVAFWYASQALYGLFQATIWVRVTAVLTVLLPQFAVHLFEAIVPDKKTRGPSRLVRVAAVLGAPMLVLELSPYHEAPLSLGLVYFYVFGLLAAALVSLARRGHRDASRAVREHVRFLVVVGALATTFTLADFLSFLGVYLPPIGAVLSVIFLFVLAESLARRRLADVYHLSGRLMVATALGFSLAGIFYVFVSVVGRFNTMYLNAVLAAVVFLILFEPLQNQVEQRIHQFFFRERFDLETSIMALRRRLAHVFEIDEMCSVLLDGFDRSRRVTTSAIYLRDSDGTGYDLLGARGIAPPARLEVLAARPLLDKLQLEASISLEELSRETREADIPLLTAAASTLGPLQNAVLLAVRSEEDELVALLIVADDRVRDAFSPEEIVLLETVATQVGATITNSNAYRRMKDRDRLAALGAMAAGLAHEVKNPLGAIKGAAQLLEEGSPDHTGEHDAQSAEFVGIILEEVDRLDRVVGSFLSYARPHEGNPVALDVNGAIRRTAQILSSQREDDVEIRLELADDLPVARIDPEQLRQVLMNLIKNAIQAMDGRGTVTVSSQRRPEISRRTDPSGAGEEGTPSRRGAIEISVRDDGPGIAAGVLKNLFVPFFTTKDRGTGLGLAISQSIVERAGGRIDVRTHAGEGTTFTIVLPGFDGPSNTPAPTRVGSSSRPPPAVAP